MTQGRREEARPAISQIDPSSVPLEVLMTERRWEQ
jgi:hypothetical protein